MRSDKNTSSLEDIPEWGDSDHYGSNNNVTSRTHPKRDPVDASIFMDTVISIFTIVATTSHVWWSSNLMFFASKHSSLRHCWSLRATATSEADCERYEGRSRGVQTLARWSRLLPHQQQCRDLNRWNVTELRAIYSLITRSDSSQKSWRSHSSKRHQSWASSGQYIHEWDNSNRWMQLPNRHLMKSNTKPSPKEHIHKWGHSEYYKSNDAATSRKHVKIDVLPLSVFNTEALLSSERYYPISALTGAIWSLVQKRTYLSKVI